MSIWMQIAAQSDGHSIGFIEDSITFYCENARADREVRNTPDEANELAMAGTS